MQTIQHISQINTENICFSPLKEYETASYSTPMIDNKPIIFETSFIKLKARFISEYKYNDKTIKCKLTDFADEKDVGFSELETLCKKFDGVGQNFIQTTKYKKTNTYATISSQAENNVCSIKLKHYNKVLTEETRFRVFFADTSKKEFHDYTFEQVRNILKSNSVVRFILHLKQLYMTDNVCGMHLFIRQIEYANTISPLAMLNSETNMFSDTKKAEYYNNKKNDKLTKNSKFGVSYTNANTDNKIIQTIVKNRTNKIFDYSNFTPIDEIIDI